MIVLSKDYTTFIYVKTNYTNLPEDKMLTYKLPSELRLEVNATGFVLLTNILFEKELSTVSIDATAPKKNGKNISDEYSISLQSQSSQIAEQLYNTFKIKSITPDVIGFYLSAKSQKVVPIKYNIKYNFLSQFSFADSLLTIPNKILIKGPRQILDKINVIETDSLVLNNIKSDLFEKVNFKITDDLKQVQLRTLNGVVGIKVDKYTETEIEIPISVESNNPNFVIKTFPSKAKIKFSVTLSKYKTIKQSMFKVTTQTSNIDLLHAEKLDLYIEKFPSFIKNTTINPTEVEFILNAKQ